MTLGSAKALCLVLFSEPWEAIFLQTKELKCVLKYFLWKPENNFVDSKQSGQKK